MTQNSEIISVFLMLSTRNATQAYNRVSLIVQHPGSGRNDLTAFRKYLN